ncbi:MAG: hypothetical protein AAFR31_05130 [Cyanobacteria bacterium J06627_8]
METVEERRARLQILVAIARANEPIKPWERAYLEQEVEALGDGASITLDHILAESPSLNSLLKAITSSDSQQQIYHDAVKLAQLDGITPARQDLLERIRTAFQLPIIQKSFSSPTSTSPSDQSLIAGMNCMMTHSHRARRLVFDYAVGAAIIGLIPFGRFGFIQPMAIALLLVKMAKDVHAHWGFSPQQYPKLALNYLISGTIALFLGGMSWLLLSLLSLVVPVSSWILSALSSFIGVWSLGCMVNQLYWNRSRTNRSVLEAIASQQETN